MISDKRLLAVRQLSVTYPLGASRHARALKAVSLDVHAGECLGILGESACGKTSTAKAILRVLPGNSRIEGSVHFAGEDLLRLHESGMQRLRGRHISLVDQNPDRALHPQVRARDQIAAVLLAHRQWSLRRCRAEADAVLTRLFAACDLPRIADAYPHQLSGGQQQRVVFAQAIACSPDLLIADEPTASLDSAAESDLLDLLVDWKRTNDGALLLVSHNPRLLARVADRLLVMYAGQVIESGPASEVLHTPRHPYTRALLRCLPEACSRDWPFIRGAPPDPTDRVSGCLFGPRCARRTSGCDTELDLVDVGDRHEVRCCAA